MEVGKRIWAVVKKGTNEIVGHPEGVMLSEHKDALRNEIKAWQPITKLGPGDVEIIPVKIRPDVPHIRVLGDKWTDFKGD
jgi:hypothetical protein